ncbi:MAG: type II toxin-antitoxin system VapC family toxin [Chloroflexi bacterium]|nr:type II toxin-antitoxin system VapC family toxin [Chloroflexota bacterium]
MRLLLDTHILLWWLNDDPRLSIQADALIADQANEVFVSPLSLWEIAIKSRLGKLRADVDEVWWTALESGCTPLPFTLEHAAEVARLPDHHHDPFDRALVAQARAEPMRLITHDKVVAAYGESVLLV